MKVLILGASGIIGQHMRLCVPDGVEPVWHRKEKDLLHVGLDFDSKTMTPTTRLIHESQAQVVVNLAGEARTDVVEQQFDLSTNVGLPQFLSTLAARGTISHYVHVSSQAVLGGNNPPYSANQPFAESAVNEYGQEKMAAENYIRQAGSGWTIVRPTFILGVRPMPAHGRQNPIEAMLEGQTRQVNDRWFSVSFARDVAEEIWRIATGDPQMRVIHLGVPERTNRYEIAKMAGVQDVVACKHEDFPGIAPRPIDTTYAGDALYKQSQPAYHSTMTKEHQSLLTGVGWCVREFHELKNLGETQRAREISIFLRQPFDACFAKLCRGFGPLHQEVAEDFRRFMGE